MGPLRILLKLHDVQKLSFYTCINRTKQNPLKWSQSKQKVRKKMGTPYKNWVVIHVLMKRRKIGLLYKKILIVRRGNTVVSSFCVRNIFSTPEEIVYYLQLPLVLEAA